MEEKTQFDLGHARREHGEEAARELDTASKTIIGDDLARACNVLETDRVVPGACTRTSAERETLDQAELTLGLLAPSRAPAPAPAAAG